MNAERLLARFERIADAPDAVARLRRFILDLAVRGRLVPQNAQEEPASELLKRITTAKGRSPDRGGPQQDGVRPISDSLPFAVAPSWKWVRFGDITLSRDGERVPVSKDDRTRRAKVYDYYGASGVIDKIDGYLFDKPLLLIGEDGANLINRSTPIAFIARGRYWVNNHAHVIDGLSEDFLRYLELFINAIDLKPYITGAAQPKMNQAKMNSIPVALPPLREQGRILATVGQLMARCDQLEAMRTEREAKRERLTTACFARLNTLDPDPARFAADARFTLNFLPSLTARKDQVDRLRDSILELAMSGRLSASKDWPHLPARLGDVATLQNGYAFKSEWFGGAGIRLLRNVNVGHGTLSWNQEARLPETMATAYERFRLNEGDIALSLDRPLISTGVKVARVQVGDLPALLLQRVGRFVLTADLDPEYLFRWLKSPLFTNQIDPGRSNGVPHISSKQVEATVLFIPSLGEQSRIVTKIDQAMALCDRLEASLSNGETTRSRLLEALLAEALSAATGQLHVTH